MPDESIELSRSMATDGTKKFVAKFVKESFGDNYQVTCGSKFTKTWKFHNAGSESWPLDTRFMFINGVQMGELSKPIDHEVKPGESIDISIDF